MEVLESEIINIDKVSSYQLVGATNPRGVVLRLPGFLDADLSVVLWLASQGLLVANVIHDDTLMAKSKDGIALATRRLVIPDKKLDKLFPDLPKIDFGTSLGGALLDEYRQNSSTQAKAKVWLSPVINNGRRWDLLNRGWKKNGNIEAGHPTNRVHLDEIQTKLLAPVNRPQELDIVEMTKSKKEKILFDDYSKSNNTTVKVVDMVHATSPEEVLIITESYVNEVLLGA